ncbi:putative dehydrogenase [Sphingopyxis panaciterrae]|uniref:Gfo/Idh/MocA family protein n=1 Tax=Sphingopyxis panaciterrae TaxID=363841 RepID=UPI001420A338|nr:Gfo/Idh/MocA family oxidoreductase [Sphingopyxis panaciterrae]NIJ36785.1 putative dehydrogenase [Sphingopyxis panaciterrae]
MPLPLRVGIISAAWGAKAHLPAWRSLDGVEVTAICTSRPETAAKAADEFKVGRAFHDFREMAADPDIDVVDCGTRPPLRHAMVMAALGAGKHVYNGIPFAKNLSDAQAMTSAWQAAGTVAVVDAFMQAVPAMVQMKAMIEAGWIGDTFGADVAFDVPLFSAAQTNVPGYVWFADPANGASAGRNLGSHMLHLLVHFFGPVASATADQSLALNAWPLDGEIIRPQVPDRTSLLLRHASGLPARLEANWCKIGGDGFRFSVWGSKGRLEARAPVFPMAHDTRLFGTQDAALGSAAMEAITIEPEHLAVPGCHAVAGRPETGLLALASIFAKMRDAINGEGRATPDFAQALHVQEVVEAAARSSDQRRWVNL